ncbi:MAG: hypothetical protein GX455_16975 [Phycisphaerae bacterium]|nr:hypothetical protein [Phycisphaerae bacterium]
MVRVLFILMIWVGELSILYIAGSRLHSLPKHSVVSETESPPPSSSFGPIRCVQRDPENGHRPLYAISLADITADSGSVFVFKTGLFKTIQVHSLRLRRYVYESDDSSTPTTMRSSPYADPAGILQDLKVVEDLVSGQQEKIRLGQGIELRVERPDFSDASQVIVDDFDYRVLVEGHSSLAIVSKRAVASYEESGILLRGGVTITANDGATLRANRVRWDPKRGSFTVEGNFLLSRGDSQTAGRAICLDEQLHKYQDRINPITEDHHYVLR